MGSSIPSPFNLGGSRMGSRILYEVNYRPIIEYNIFMFIISSILVYIYREEIQKIIDDLKD